MCWDMVRSYEGKDEISEARHGESRVREVPTYAIYLYVPHIERQTAELRNPTVRSSRNPPDVNCCSLFESRAASDSSTGRWLHIR